MSPDPELQLRGIVLRSDRADRRISALTPQGLWHFTHPNPSRKGGARAAVLASALNPLCLSHFTFISRERGWGWLRSAQLEAVLWPDLGGGSGKSAEQRQQMLDSLKVSSRLRRLTLLSQQPAADSPLLFQLLLTCLRRLLSGSPPSAILGIFGVKLLMHEGRWPAKPACLLCDANLLGRELLLGSEGFLCLNCQKRGEAPAGGVQFTQNETDRLCGIGLRRTWSELAELEIGSLLGEKIASAAEMIALHAN